MRQMSLVFLAIGLAAAALVADLVGATGWSGGEILVTA